SMESKYKVIDMQQAALNTTQSNIHVIEANSAENNDVSYPWFLIQPDNTRVRYRHDWITDFFGQDKKQDGLGLLFQYSKYLEPGSTIDIGIPLPEGIHRYRADVIVVGAKDDGFEIGIWLHTNSDSDLELLLRSCEYAS
ncbi:MAG: hypothetical protein AAF419_03160, partial [Pseudomonadota bacterium]